MIRDTADDYEEALSIIRKQSEDVNTVARENISVLREASIIKARGSKGLSKLAAKLHGCEVMLRHSNCGS